MSDKEQTPAQKRGLVVGKQYRFFDKNQADLNDGEYGDSVFPKNSIVTFKEDDGTVLPAFYGESWEGENWHYAYIEYIHYIEPDTKNDGASNAVVLIEYKGQWYNKVEFEKAISNLIAYKMGE